MGGRRGGPCRPGDADPGGDIGNARATRLVVFDWDGTLIDSIGSIVDCTYAMLDELGLPHLARTEVLSLIGRGLEECVNALAPEGDLEIRERVVATYRRLWFSEYHHRADLIEGARKVIEELLQADCWLAVATAKSRAGLVSDLERLGLAETFHASRTPDESPAKPNPGMLLEMLDELGVRADETLMVGDSIHDVQMAHNAGVPVVAVGNGAQSVESLMAADPLACLQSVVGLPQWMRENG